MRESSGVEGAVGLESPLLGPWELEGKERGCGVLGV